MITNNSDIKGKFLRYLIVLMVIFCGMLMSLNLKPSSCAQDSEEYVNIPILMYHSVLKSKKGRYTVSPSMLEEDIKYLKSHGYEAIFI